MATAQPPTYFFNGIQFNDGFFNTGTTEGGGITQSFADNAYLARNGSGVTSIANDTTFLGSLTATANTNSIISKASIANTIATTGVTDATQYYVPFVPLKTTSTSQNLYTDSGAGNHLAYTPSTNTFNVGGTTNGNITVTGTASTVSIAGTGTALSIPNGTVTIGTGFLNVSGTSSTITASGTTTAIAIPTGNLVCSGTGAVIQATSGAANINRISVSSGATNAINLSNGGIFVATSVSLGGYINLPSTYSAVPSSTQLGAYSVVTFTGGQALTTSGFKNLGQISLPAGGTYIINLSVSVTATAAVTLSRFVVEASTNNAAFTNNISLNTQYGSWPLVSSQGQIYTTAITITTTVATNVFGNGLFAFTGTMTGGGSISYTRIA